MAAAVTWGIISAAFTPAGGSVFNISDCTEISFKDSIDLQNLLTDANVNVNLVFGTGGVTEFSLKSTDTSLAWGSTVKPGVEGSLVLVFGKRAGGKGYVSGQNKTMTASNAVIGERNGGASPAQAGSSDWSFRAYDPAGTGIFAVA